MNYSSKHNRFVLYANPLLLGKGITNKSKNDYVLKVNTDYLNLSETYTLPDLNSIIVYKKKAGATEFDNGTVVQKNQTFELKIGETFKWSVPSDYTYDTSKVVLASATVSNFEISEPEYYLIFEPPATKEDENATYFTVEMNSTDRQKRWVQDGTSGINNIILDETAKDKTINFYIMGVPDGDIYRIRIRNENINTSTSSPIKIKIGDLECSLTIAKGEEGSLNAQLKRGTIIQITDKGLSSSPCIEFYKDNTYTPTDDGTAHIFKAKAHDTDTWVETYRSGEQDVPFAHLDYFNGQTYLVYDQLMVRDAAFDDPDWGIESQSNIYFDLRDTEKEFPSEATISNRTNEYGCNLYLTPDDGDATEEFDLYNYTYSTEKNVWPSHTIGGKTCKLEIKRNRLSNKNLKLEAYATDESGQSVLLNNLFYDENGNAISYLAWEDGKTIGYLDRNSSELLANYNYKVTFEITENGTISNNYLKVNMFSEVSKTEKQNKVIIGDSEFSMKVGTQDMYIYENDIVKFKDNSAYSEEKPDQIAAYTDSSYAKTFNMFDQEDGTNFADEIISDPTYAAGSYAQGKLTTASLEKVAEGQSPVQWGDLIYWHANYMS